MPPFYFRIFHVALKSTSNILQRHTVLFPPSKQFCTRHHFLRSATADLAVSILMTRGLDVAAAALSTRGFHRHDFIWSSPPTLQGRKVTFHQASLSLSERWDKLRVGVRGILKTSDRLPDQGPPRNKPAWQLSLVAQSYPTPLDPMDCSTSGFPVFHHLLELA